MKIIVACAAAILFPLCLASCASLRDVETPLCPHQQVNFDLEKMHAGPEIDIYLPRESVLVDENTEDARYWAWETGAGQISVAWISKIAREHYWEANRNDACLLLNDGREMLVFPNGNRWNVVTWPLNDSKSGLLLSFDLRSEKDVAVIYEVGASLEVRER